MKKRTVRKAKNAVETVGDGLQELIDSAQELLDQLEGQQGEAVERLRARVTDTIDSTHSRLESFRRLAGTAARKGGRSAARFARRDPWRAVAIGALVALGVQLWLRSGHSSDDDAE